MAYDDYRIEYYRGVGGYNNRWLVRKVRRIPQHKTFVFMDAGIMMMSPESCAMIRNIIP